MKEASKGDGALSFHRLTSRPWAETQSIRPRKCDAARTLDLLPLPDNLAPLVELASPNPALHESGQLFNPRAVSLEAWLEYGRRLRGLFERNIGMQAEHYWTISRALESLGLEPASTGSLQRWAGCTATILVRREDLLGGRLARLATTELEGQGSSGNGCQDLDRNVGRFVQPVSSTADTPALRATQANCETT
jgi:hypothetical protein